MDINLSFIKNNYFLRILEEYLKKLFQINKKLKGIILFGSLSRDNAAFSDEKISDIDLIVVFFDNELPDDHKERTKLKLKLMDLTELGIDSLWMTETEFKNLIKIKADIILSALDEGKVLYDPGGLIKEQKKKLFKELKEKGVIKRRHYWIWPIKNLGDEIEW